MQPKLHRNVVAVVEAARALGLELDVREFPEGTHTAADAAAAIGVEVAQICKTLVFGVGDPGDRPATEQLVIAFVSGANQLDERKLAAAAGARGAWRVDANAVREATGFPVGGVPPFGHRTELRRFVDLDLLGFDVIWAAAGTPRNNFPISPQDLQKLTGAVGADLARGPAPSAATGTGA